MRMARAAIIIGCGLLGYVAWTTVTSAHTTVATIGQQTARSIMGVRELRARLVELDESASNDLLAGGFGSASARARYDTSQQEVSRLLVQAAQSATNDNDRHAVDQVVGLVTRYNGLVQAARANNRQVLPVGASYQNVASKLMHQQLLPLVDQLDKSYTARMQYQYDRQVSAFTIGQVLGVGVGVMLIAVLVGTQLFLTRRTRRLINIPLAIGTAVVVVFTAWLSLGLHSSSTELSAGAKPAFDALYRLWQVRATATDAKGDISLFLIARGNGEAFEKSFTEKTTSLANAPTTDARSGQPAGRGEVRTGQMAEALKGVSSREQTDLLEEAVASFDSWMQFQNWIRELEKQGQHQQAVDLTLANDTGSATEAFQHFDQAIGKVMEINQRDFDQAIGQALGVLSWLIVAGVTVAVIVSILASVGLAPRLKEYQV